MSLSGMLVQGQGGYMKSSPPAPTPEPSPFIDLCNIAATREILAFCSTACNTQIPAATPAPPAPQLASSGEPRRLAKAPHPTHILKCPRCASIDTKFCYYNNYSLSQPRYFCKNCKRYWTAGGVLRNVPVGGGLRKNKRSKLKLAAEAEAAAAAARADLSTHEPHHEGKSPSPLQEASLSANSSIVIGVPASFGGPAPAPAPAPAPSLHSHGPTAAHLPRTSSGSDCSTIDYAGNESCAAVSAGLGVMAPHQLQHFYKDSVSLCAAAQSQFYASYGASSMVSSNQQYSGNSGANSSSYNFEGYDAASCSQSLIGLEEVRHSNRNNGNAATSDSVLMMGKGNYDASVNDEKEEMSNSSSGYDWRFISDNLFNGEGLLHVSGGSWSDFTQFHDLGTAEK